MKTEYSFFRYIPVWSSHRLHAMKPIGAIGGFAEANAGLQPAAVLKPDRDNDTPAIRGPAIRKAGWLNSNGAVKQHTAACEKSYISKVTRKSTEKPYFQKALLVLYQHDIWQACSSSFGNGTTRLSVSDTDILKRISIIPLAYFRSSF
ncbi:MAG: hypothetical protein ACLR8P_20160 [Clostridium fessum]